MIYHRIKPLGTLEEKDYRLGFGIDSDLLNQVRKAKLCRGIEIVKGMRFDNRIGFAIDMTPFNNTYHPMFQFDIIDTETNEQLQIDSYSQCFWYGEYWQMMAMNKETRSHRQILWKNVTCHDTDFIKDIQSNNKKYKLVKAEKPRWLPNGDPIKDQI